MGISDRVAVGIRLLERGGRQAYGMWGIWLVTRRGRREGVGLGDG